ncbi:bifunctional DNA-formamidopyrimidine glycosylase/DNA-(apurinic or apyrimidinic site) lyase [bacterium]|nr:bifunctional DNA-formamidopyrimidine glycosylase/DNA-(apurinic or apyrimidinic site) lyase [bacterium]
MPELPEVETVVRGLRRSVLGKTVTDIVEHRPGTVRSSYTDAEHGAITAVSRRGKYILIMTSKRRKFIIHLRMTGKLIYTDDRNSTSSHCRAAVIFADNSALIFDDVRTFGSIRIIPEESLSPQIEALGPEPLSRRFTADYLKEQAQQRKIAIKTLLLDQRVIAGLGNIYAIEILHASGIDPRQRADTLNEARFAAIVSNTKTILKKAIRLNGTTISDFRRIDEKSGSFQEFLAVYQKKTCRCGNPVEKTTISGRSTYFCAVCQR